MSNRPDMDLTPEARRVFDQCLQTISFRSEVYYRGQICENWYLDTSGTGHITCTWFVMVTAGSGVAGVK
jgi:hypothetical protein